MPSMNALASRCDTICPDFEEYAITRSGGVYRGLMRLAAWLDRDGYWRVRVRSSRRKGRRYHDRRVAHLVAAAHLGVPDCVRRRKRLMVWPLDGDASNHNASNLVVIARTPEAVRFEKDTRPDGELSAEASRRMRREFILQKLRDMKQNPRL